MIVVIKKKGDTTDSLFKKFSRMYKTEDIVFEVNRKLFFKKPALLKKEKQRERIRRRIRQRKGMI